MSTIGRIRWLLLRVFNVICVSLLIIFDHGGWRHRDVLFMNVIFNSFLLLLTDLRALED